MRPDLELINLRGNVETRLSALSDGKVDALILAQAGLNRLIENNQKQIVQDVESSPLLVHPWNTIPSSDMLPAACQGVVAVTCRKNDKETIACLTRINNRDAMLVAAAERAFLDTLDGFSPSKYHGVSIQWAGRPPLAAFLEKKNDHDFLFHGLLARPDGSKVLRDSIPVSFPCNGAIPTNEAAKVGRETAEHLVQIAGDYFFE